MISLHEYNSPCSLKIKIKGSRQSVSNTDHKLDGICVGQFDIAGEISWNLHGCALTGHLVFIVMFVTVINKRNNRVK